jgi:hypothetical protein
MIRIKGTESYTQYSIVKDNNVLWTSSGGYPISTDLVYGMQSDNQWIEDTPPIILDERRMLQLVVEKTGSEHGWIASFSAMGTLVPPCS